MPVAWHPDSVMGFMHIRKREETVEVTDNRFWRPDAKVTALGYTLSLPGSQGVNKYGLV